MKVTVYHTFVSTTELEVPEGIDPNAEKGTPERQAFFDWWVERAQSTADDAKWDSTMVLDENNNELYSS